MESIENLNYQTRQANWYANSLDEKESSDVKALKKALDVAEDSETREALRRSIERKSAPSMSTDDAIAQFREELGESELRSVLIQGFRRYRDNKIQRRKKLERESADDDSADEAAV